MPHWAIAKKPEEAEELFRELFVQLSFSCESPSRRGWQQKKERRGTTSCHPITAGANLPQHNCFRILYILPRNSTGKMNRVLPLPYAEPKSHHQRKSRKREGHKLEILNNH